MAYRVIVGWPAQNSVDSAAGYISNNLFSPEAARSLLAKYNETLARVSTFPFLCSVDFEASKVLGYEVRSVRVLNYRVLYHADSQLERVDVLAFIHMRQNAARYLADYYGDSER